MTKEKISFAIDKYTKEKMDKLIKELGFSSRNMFVEKAIFYYILYLEKEKSKKS